MRGPFMTSILTPTPKPTLEGNSFLLGSLLTFGTCPSYPVAVTSVGLSSLLNLTATAISFLTTPGPFLRMSSEFQHHTDSSFCGDLGRLDSRGSHIPPAWCLMNPEVPYAPLM